MGVWVLSGMTLCVLESLSRCVEAGLHMPSCLIVIPTLVNN